MDCKLNLPPNASEIFSVFLDCLPTTQFKSDSAKVEAAKSEVFCRLAESLKQFSNAVTVQVQTGERHHSQCEVVSSVVSAHEADTFPSSINVCRDDDLEDARKKAITAIQQRNTAEPIVIPFGSRFVLSHADLPMFNGAFAVAAGPETRFDVLADLVSPEGISLLSQLMLTLYGTYFRNERLGEFAHDVKHYVMIGEELLRTALRSEGELHRKALNKLETNLKRVLLETNTVLLADKSDSGTLVYSPLPIQITEIVHEVLSEEKILFEAAQIPIFSDLSSDVPETAIDPALFPTVVQNLFDNAIKYSDAKGPVQLQVSPLEDGVRLEISNPGEPLSEQDLQALFDRYYRGANSLHKPGSGLGLYLVRRIVDLHGGTISVHQEGRQTTFAVDLPFMQKP